MGMNNFHSLTTLAVTLPKIWHQVTKCETNDIHITLSATTGQSRHQHQGGSWSKTNMLNREECVLTALIYFRRWTLLHVCYCIFTRWISYISTVLKLSTALQIIWATYSIKIQWRWPLPAGEHFLPRLGSTAARCSTKKILMKHKSNLVWTAFRRSKLAGHGFRTEVAICGFLCILHYVYILYYWLNFGFVEKLIGEQDRDEGDRKNKNDTKTCSSFVPEMASSIFLRAPNVVMPSSFRSWSVRVRKVWRSICKQQQVDLTQYISYCIYAILHLSNNFPNNILYMASSNTHTLSFYIYNIEI